MSKSELIHELSSNFIEYAASVNLDRAIPDARSGLKPVARRILWGAYDSGYTSNKSYVKCGLIVGDVMGHWHPHGDSSIYGALVHMSQPWVMRYPLIDFHGNMGNISGDGPAAYRYTNARLSKLAEDGMLNGLKKKVVDFVPNYDENMDEPLTLPAVFPNLLCNPNTGIGVAMACQWLPHNLNEVGQSIIDYMEGKEPNLPGPDFPTGGIVINKKDIPAIMRTGRGSVKVRGKYKIEKNNIIFYEIPYGITLENLLKEIGEVCDNKEIEGISEVRDESNKKGMRIVIECQRNVNIDSIVKKLFAKTNLQTSLSYNQVALVNKTPVELNLVDCIKIYIEHNIECIKREAKFDLNKALSRLEIVDGLLKALEDIDNVIAVIKKSKSSADAVNNLITVYNLTENQAKAIVDMKLGKLAGLEKVELQNEKTELDNSVDKLNALINSENEQKELLKSKLLNIMKRYGDARRTEITQIDITPETKEIETVTPEDVVVVLSRTGEIKRVPAKSFKVQRKNGKGAKSADDAILDVISTNTIDTLMLFTNKGRMFRMLVDTIPSTTNAGKGVRVGSLISLESNESVMAITSLYRKSTAKYVVFFTKNGTIKKTALEEYTKMKKSTGVPAIKLADGDAIANVTFLNDEEVILLTKSGMAIHFNTDSIAAIGRVTVGVRAIKLMDGDEVLVGLPVHKSTDCVAVFTQDGMAKKMRIQDFTLQARGGKGVKYCKVDDIIIGAAMVSDEDNLLLIGKPNTICISAKDIPTYDRLAGGNVMIKNSTINSVVKL